jgi:hypothetical protein
MARGHVQPVIRRHAFLSHQDAPMKNPWTAKNPFMSMWLSAANSAAGSARGHASAAVQREIRKSTHTVFDQALQEWTRALTPTAPARAPRKRRKAR